MVALPFTWMRLDSGESEVLLVSPFGHSPPQISSGTGERDRGDSERGPQPWSLITWSAG